MGTRADFWIGSGPEAEWLGSVAFDGYEWAEEEGNAVMAAPTADDFRRRVAIVLERDDATVPAQGWPWPWSDSTTTDYAYVFEDGEVTAYAAGSSLKDDGTGPRHGWRDMTAFKNVTYSPRSGLIIGIKT